MSSSLLHPSFTFNGLQFSEPELKEFAEKLQDDGADYEQKIGKFIAQWLSDSLEIKVKTSGSTGAPKKIILQKKQMIASAHATSAFFKLGASTSALLCLPVNFIAGKMMLVRAMILGWDLHVVAPEKDALTQYDNEYDFAAMVPYQVFHTLDAIHKIKKLIIGGGAVSSELRARLQTVPTEVFETYGMTETITHIAVKRINGLAASSVFSALPDVKFSQDDRGCLVVNAPSISEVPVITNDIVALKAPTQFNWLGRFDNVINSGGYKLHPEIIEAKLSKMIDRPFVIIGEKDATLGERAVLIFEAPNTEQLPNYSEAFASLDPYERPKKVYTLSKFPHTETGKIKRADVKNIFKTLYTD
jgi:O-succinylbenzoic acid--CoA ligase